MVKKSNKQPANKARVNKVNTTKSNFIGVVKMEQKLGKKSATTTKNTVQNIKYSNDKYAGGEVRKMMEQTTKAEVNQTEQEVFSIRSEDESSYDSNREELPELERRRELDEESSSDEESEYSDEETSEDVEMEDPREGKDNEVTQIPKEKALKKPDPTILEHPSNIFDCNKHFTKTKPWTDGMKVTFRYVKTMTESGRGYLKLKSNHWHFVPENPTLRIHKIKKVKKMSKSILEGWYDSRVFEYLLQWTHENNNKIWKEFKAEGKLPDTNCEEDENWEMLKETDEDNRWCYKPRTYENEKNNVVEKSYEGDSSIIDVDMEDSDEDKNEVIVNSTMDIDDQDYPKHKRERSKEEIETSECTSPAKKRDEQGIEAIVTPNKESKVTDFEWADYELEQDETEENQKKHNEDNEGFIKVKRKEKTKKTSLQHIVESGGIRSGKGGAINQGGRGRGRGRGGGRGYELRSLIQDQSNNQSSIIEHFKPKPKTKKQQNKRNEEEIESGSSTEDTESTPIRSEPRKVHFEKSKPPANPYIIKKKQQEKKTTKEKQTPTETQESKAQKHIPNYSEAAKEKQRKQHSNEVRLRFTYKNNNGPATTFKSVLQNLLTIANTFDKEAMIMTWEYEKEHGPKKLIDLQTEIVHDREFMRYMNVPVKNKTHGFTTKGTTYYDIGVRFSTNLELQVFKDSWDLKKREIIAKQQQFLPVRIAEVQDGPEAYIIGIAAGSTEGMSYQAINDNISDIVGVEGIRASYQKYHQTGITKDYWKRADQKAAETKAARNSRAYNEVRYKWAPEALCFYVLDKTKQKEARLAMIKKFGVHKKNVEIPAFPGGSRMRFVPLKQQGPITSPIAHNKVSQQLRVHTWMKVHEKLIPTDYTNITGTIPAFKGKSFEEIVMETTNGDGKKMFRHFKKVWNPDPRKKEWTLSVHTKYFEEAIKASTNLETKLKQQYGDEVDQFLYKKPTQDTRGYGSKAPNNNDDDDEWFTDNDIISEYEKEFLIEGFEQAFGEQAKKADNPDDDDTNPSWTNRDNGSAITRLTESSTLTMESTVTQVSKTSIEERKESLKKYLRTSFEMPENIVEMVLEGVEQYKMIQDIIKLPSYDEAQLLMLILNIHNQEIQAATNEDIATNLAKTLETSTIDDAQKEIGVNIDHEGAQAPSDQ